MKERPILFSGPLVLAILEGRKTQTRRVIRPQPVQPGEESRESYRQASATDLLPEWWWSCAVVGAMLDVGSEAMLCRSPYGVPDHELWVRESFWQLKQPPLGAPLGADFKWVNKPECVRYGDYFRRWDAERADSVTRNAAEHGYYRRPSIHMPRWASRIQLRVTGVRVEGLQEITEEDAGAEGCIEKYHSFGDGQLGHYCRLHTFAKLWDSINAARGFAWRANPWVWVVDFERIRP